MCLKMLKCMTHLFESSSTIKMILWFHIWNTTQTSSLPGLLDTTRPWQFLTRTLLIKTQNQSLYPRLTTFHISVKTMIWTTNTSLISSARQVTFPKQSQKSYQDRWLFKNNLKSLTKTGDFSRTILKVLLDITYSFRKSIITWRA